MVCGVVTCLLSIVASGQDLDQARRLIRDGASQEAIGLLEPAVARLEQAHDTTALVRALALLGRARYDAGQLPAALADLHRTIDLGVHTSAHGEVGKAYTIKAIIAQENSEPDSAKHDYERAVEHFLLAGDTAACAIVYDNLGYFPLAKGDIPGAIAWSQKALTCLRDTLHPEYYRTAALINSSLSNYLTWSGNIPLGLEYGERSLHLAQRSGELYSIVQTGTQLAGAYLAAKDTRKALKLLLRSDSLARANAFPLIKRRDIAELLSSTYEQLGDRALALHYYKERAALNDSVRGNTTRRELERMERRQIHVADSLHHAGEMREQSLVHEQQSAAQRRTVYLVLAGCAVLLVIALIIWDRYRRLRAANETIITTQNELLESERAREAEAVRARIARDIHDEIGSELTKITLLGALAKQRIAQSLGEATDTVERMRSLSKGLGSSLSDVVWAVDPQHDSVRALVDHARAFAHRMLEGTSTPPILHFEHTGPDRSIDASTKRDIFLVMKEALNNAMKHASAHTIEVRLETTGERYHMMVKDDGGGFEQADRGNGLGNMRARAKALGATITITSSPGSGTTVDMHGSFA